MFKNYIFKFGINKQGFKFSNFSSELEEKFQQICEIFEKNCGKIWENFENVVVNLFFENPGKFYAKNWNVNEGLKNFWQILENTFKNFA